MFIYRFIRFQYSHERKVFEPIVFNSSMPCNYIQEELSKGLSETSENPGTNYHVQMLRYGLCDIIIPIKSLPALLINEVLNPFYLF